MSEATMSNEKLAQHVVDELRWDPKVDSDTIAVEAEGGTVTLRGTVGSLRQRREARKATERVYGVVGVIDDLDVTVLTEHRREDAELRGDVLQALMLDAVVPSTVDANVKDGLVELTGTASWQYQRDEAEFVAGNVPGVLGVRTTVILTSPAPYAPEVKHSIKKALERDAKLDADRIAVETINGIAVLSGTVRSWSEHDAAVTAAWAAPGVTAVEDRLVVTY
jgi:osmotically-inducible protein OsmY